MEATYISSNQFSVEGYKTEEFSAGRRLKVTDSSDGVKYLTVSSSSYSTPNTIVTTKESELSSDMVSVLYGVIAPGITGSLPDHTHDGAEGSGGSLDLGAGALIELTDVPTYYDEGKYLRATASGTEWATVSGGSSEVQSFLDLTDTPTTFSGAEGRYLYTTSSGIEFIDGIILNAPNDSKWLLRVTNSGTLYTEEYSV